MNPRLQWLPWLYGTTDCFGLFSAGKYERTECIRQSPYHYLGCFAFDRGLSENYYFPITSLGLRQCRAAIKGSPALCSLIHFSCLLLLGNQVNISSRAMSCCQPCGQSCGPTPLASSCNEPCCRQCQSSIVVIEPSPVVVTLPGPILSSFPQNTAVGSSTSAAVGSILSCNGVPINSGCCDLSCISSCYRCPPAKHPGNVPGKNLSQPQDVVLGTR
ncbi:LOW QUALITY PROTEIN: uncharacterized protein LOC115599765 [Calypte anna]|uniref:LOW QUALITY PROTEIN: uncharacterized protein LOC115599765 n=1 Tax=Calypte anna TaxID=9244 RepID=UPI0011C43A8C|nr:LOW QUALITY PROTEIN: uncharacterized protein LOC115599765 [Calypte anna]